MGACSAMRMSALGGMTLRAVSKGIKFAYGVAKGVKAVSSVNSVRNPLQGVLLVIFGAKTIAKGASRGVLVKADNATFKVLSKCLKASEGALNLVRYSTDLHMCGWESLVTSYKLFKSAFKVLEGTDMLAKLPLEESGLISGAEKVIKVGLDSVGVVVKAFTLSKHINGVVINRMKVSSQAFLELLEDVRIRSGIRRSSKSFLCLPTTKVRRAPRLHSTLKLHNSHTLEPQPIFSLLASTFQFQPPLPCEDLFSLSIPHNANHPKVVSSRKEIVPFSHSSCLYQKPILSL